MERLKELMGLGILIEPEAMDLIKSLNKEDLQKVVSEAKVERPLMLTQDLVRKYLSKIEMRIVKRSSKLEKITIADLTNMLNEKYNILKDVLLKKIELQNIVSINKASAGEVTVIGIIKDIEEKADRFLIEAEDPTGMIKCIIPKELTSKLSLDDVVSLSGDVRNKVMFANEVSFPDVPIRQANYSKEDVKVAFVNSFSEGMNIKADFIFMLNPENIKRAREKYSNAQVFSLSEISVPSIIDIAGVKIMFLIDFDPLAALKKRCISIENSDFIIDVLPDIIFTNKKTNSNYKSISILGENVIINLKDREIKEINT